MRFNKFIPWLISWIVLTFAIALATNSMSFSQPRPSYHQGLAYSASESAYPGSWKGLVGAWVPALGNTGNRVLDVSSVKNHATIDDFRAQDWHISNNPRVPGTTYELNPSSLTNSFNMPANAQQNLTEPLSVTAIIFPENVGGDNLMYGAWNTADVSEGWGFDLAPTGGLRIWDGTAFRASTTGLITINTWNHVAVTIDNASLCSFYVNGVAAGTAACSAITLFSNQNVIGAESDGDGRDFDGFISSVRLYNRALNAGEIWLDYQVSLAPFILRRQLLVRAPAAAAAARFFAPIFFQ